MRVFSIDPGITGALCLFDNGQITEAYAMPWKWVPALRLKHKKKKVIDLFVLGELFKRAKADYVVIEKVHSMPGQGVASTFNFGFAYGAVKALAESFVEHEVIDVRPQEWKKHFNLIGTEKKEATELAKTLSTRVTSSGKADAYLIGKWFLEANTFRDGEFLCH